MKNGMLSVVCREPGALALEERPLPERKADQILLGIRRIGICGRGAALHGRDRD